MQKSINHQGKRIAYKVVGNGKPLMLIHGFGEDSTVWETMLPFIGGLKLIMPDVPGAGGSELLNGEPSLEALADAMATLIKEECDGPCYVVGHSMGGYIALALVERHAKLVEAFGLVHSHPFPDDNERKAKRDKDIDFIKRQGSPAYIKVLLPALFSEPFKKQHSAVVTALVDHCESLSPEGLIYALTAMKNRLDRSSVVSSSTKAFLLIAGVEDQVVTLETVSKIYKMPQYTFGLFIREAAHMGMIEFPEACAKHLFNWIQSDSIRK